jgi:hypothetical protein
MDDGLTSLSGKDVKQSGTGITQDFHGHAGVSATWYLTFIGTGISFVARDNATAGTNDGNRTIAQNLPYGTHIIKVVRVNAPGVYPTVTLDGVAISITTAMPYASFGEVSIHQPEMPPIPEDAVVIADYMLMADYVEQTSSEDSAKISKGVRSCCGGRDVFADDSSWTANATVDAANVGPWGIYAFRSGSSAIAKLPYFGTAVNVRMQDTAQAHTVAIDGSTKTTTARDNSTESTRDMKTMSIAQAGVDVGSHTVLMDSAAGFVGRFIGFDIVSPIHTSSHYQTFETPFLHELVGGDRNMEQNNLVVTPDDKTWDEVTRDTSYIGPEIHRWGWITGHYGADTKHASTSGRPWIGRGLHYGHTYGNKNFAYAYDRHICLKNGWYALTCRTYLAHDWGQASVYVNGTHIGAAEHSVAGSSNSVAFVRHVVELKRGDYVQAGNGHAVSAGNWSTWFIERLEPKKFENKYN